MRRKLAPMLFAEDDPVGKAAQRKNAVEPAKPSPQAKKKARSKLNNEGEKVMSFANVMDKLAGFCRLIVVLRNSADKTPGVITVACLATIRI